MNITTADAGNRIQSATSPRCTPCRGALHGRALGLGSDLTAHAAHASIASPVAAKLEDQTRDCRESPRFGSTSRG
jgi:hypothetical protein